jgi:hypothetical protein
MLRAHRQRRPNPHDPLPLFTPKEHPVTEHDETTTAAISLVARAVAWQLIDDACDWGDLCAKYPEIGENDWERVVSVMRFLVAAPADEEFTGAYAHLESRAKDFADGGA